MGSSTRGTIHIVTGQKFVEEGLSIGSQRQALYAGHPHFNSHGYFGSLPIV